MGEYDETALLKYLDDMAEITEILENSAYCMIESKIQEAAQGLGLCEIGLNHDVSELSGGQRAKVLLAKLLIDIF